MIDLHTHSTYSDGTCTPKELIGLAQKSGVSVLALTDHDTIRGVDEAAKFASLSGIRFIPGVELEIEIPKGEFHLLGLGITKNRDEFENTLADVRNFRTDRNKEIIKKMNAWGIAITLHEVEKIAAGEIVARPHFARALIDKKIVKSLQEAFDRFLEKGKPFYSPKKTLSLSDAIGLITHSGGIPVIAHPFTLHLSFTELKSFLLSARGSGLIGIEVFHPKAARSTSTRLASFAKENGFLASGGSDFHGKNTPGVRLGYISGTRKIPEELAEQF